MTFDEWWSSDESRKRFHPDSMTRAAWCAAAAAEREALRELLTKAREVAEWHVCDGDECGILARIVMAEIDASLECQLQ